MRKWMSKEPRGATVVEFAVIVPLLLFILFGVIEYGIIFMQVHMIENAAREGVRRGVVADTYDCWNTECTAPRYAAVVENVQNYLANFYPGLTGTPSPGPDDSNFVAVRRIAASADRKWLIVTVEVDNFMPKLISAFFGNRFNLEKIHYTARGEYENPVEE